MNYPHDFIVIDTKEAQDDGIDSECIMNKAQDFFDCCYHDSPIFWDGKDYPYIFKGSRNGELIGSRDESPFSEHYQKEQCEVINWYQIINNSELNKHLVDTKEFKEELL